MAFQEIKAEMIKAILTAFLVFFTVQCFAATHYVTNNTAATVTPSTTFDPDTGPASAGDTIIIDSTRTTRLTFEDFDGTAGSKYYFKNDSDAVTTITEGTDIQPLRFFNCDNIVIDGTNYSSEAYGIVLEGSSTNNTAGIVLSQCADWEITGVKVQNTGLGFRCNNHDDNQGQSNPDTSWTQIGGGGANPQSVGDCHIHHNKIATTIGDAAGDFGEGMYMGKSTTGDYPQFDTLEINDNDISSTNAEGIQAGQIESSSGWLKIYNNSVVNYGTADHTDHNQGINLSAEWANASVYNNYIKTGTGHGIYARSAGSSMICTENVIVDAGNSATDPENEGIKNKGTGAANDISDNLICIAGGDGIRTVGGDGTLNDNLVYGIGDVNFNNLAGYSESGNTTFTPGDYFKTWSDDSNFDNDDFAPKLSFLAPTGEQSCTSDPRNVTESWSSTFDCECRVDTTDQSYSAMGSGNDADTTGDESHSDTISRACGGSYTRYVRCLANGWLETSTGTISYSVAAGAGGGAVGEKFIGIKSQGVRIK